MKTLEISLIVLVLVLVSVISYGAGVYAGVNTAITLGAEFVDIEVDTEMLTRAIYQYDNRISGCLFNQNASISID